MKTILRIAALTVLFFSAAENAKSGITLTANTVNNAPSQLAVGQTFNYTISYFWSKASHGDHQVTLLLNLPTSLEFVSASKPVTRPGPGIITCMLPVIAVPSTVEGPFGTSKAGPLGNGSGSLAITVRVIANTGSNTQACLTGTISEGIVKSSTGNSCVAIPNSVPAPVPCSCSGVISSTNLAGGTASTGVVFDFGAVGSLPCTDLQACYGFVAARVNQMSSGQRQLMESDACRSSGNGSTIRAFAKLGNQSYALVKVVGTLTNTAATSVTTCMCPAGWTSNTSGVAGGVTTDGKCKKQVATMTTSPAPPNTPIGTWGFTVGTAVYVWGSATNGGAPVCTTTVTAPKVCKIQ